MVHVVRSPTARAGDPVRSLGLEETARFMRPQDSPDTVVYGEARTMWERLSKQAAFWASLLLSLCVLDGTFPRGLVSLESEPSDSLDHFALTIRLDSGEGVSNPDFSWTMWILRQVEGETRTGRPAHYYHPVSEVSGEGAGIRSEKLESGTYWVLARSKGFARASAHVVLSKPRTVDLVLHPAEPFSVKVLAETEGQLTPLSGATVLVGPHGDLPLGARTDEKGQARFESLPPGPKRVRIFAPGYEPYEGIAEGDLLVRLRPVSTVRVHVLDDGRPQADAQVVIAGVQLWPARTVITGMDGFVDLAGLRPGRYALYAEKGAKVSQVSSDVEVRTEAGLVEVTLRLNDGVFVAAQVREKEEHDPIQGARVTWSSSGLGQFSRHARTDGQGMVRLGPLTEWGGVLSVRAHGFVARMVPVELPGDRDPPGPGVQIIDLERAAVIEGRVVDSEGFPVAGATVEVAGTDVFNMPVSITHLSEEISDAHFDWARESANVLMPAGELGVMLGPVPPIPLGDVVPMEGRRLTTDERGYFVVDGVPPGEAVVLARHPDHMDGKSDVLFLAPDARVKTTVVLGRGEPLRGRVLDHRGFPVSNARIQASAPGFDRRVTAETDGTFSLAAAPQDVTLRISRIEQPLRVVFARDVEKKERPEEIQIKLPRPREEAVVSVIDGAKEPVELAQISLVSLDKQVPFKKTLFTDHEGKATFEEAAGLRVRLNVGAPGYVEKSSELTLPKSFSLTLTESLVATGRVMGVRGRLPAAGAAVEFRSGSVTRTAIADDLGEYRLVGIPPGTGELSASHPEFGKGEKKVLVKRGPDERPPELPDLIVSPTLQVSGRVVDERGDPLAGAVIATHRLSPYLPAGGGGTILGTSDESGEFEVDVQREAGTYLYAALLGRAYGFSDDLPETDLDRLEDVDIVIDRKDRIPPHEHGTVLVALEDRPKGVLVYAVAEGSDAKKAGMRVDDLVVEVDGNPVEDAEEAREFLSGTPGTDVRIGVRRGGRTIDLLVARETFMR